MAAVAGSAFAEAGAFTGPELADAAQDAEVAGGHLIVVASDRAVVYGGPVARGSGRSRSRPR
jgi:hypothetical protein